MYGYTKSLSRREEQNKRYQKRLKQIQNKNVHHNKDQGKGMLNDLFEVNKFMSDKDLLERYAAHLNKVMMIGKSKFLMERYHIWTSQDIQETKQLNFYERMRIDDIVRKNKKQRAIDVRDKSPVAAARKTSKRSETTKDSIMVSDQSEDDEDEDEEKRLKAEQEQERKQRIQQLQTTLKITAEQATEIERMTRIKGLQKKIGVNKEQEELSMGPFTGQQVKDNQQLL